MSKQRKRIANVRFTYVTDRVEKGKSIMYDFDRIVDRRGTSCLKYDFQVERRGRLVYKDGKYSIDFDDFEKKIVDENVKLFILCSPHNPVGRVWTEDELRRMGEICFKHKVIVVSDEIHCDFTYEGHKHITFPSLGEEFEKNVILCTAPSKTFNIAGLHVSNIFIPNPEIRKQFKGELEAIGFSQPNIMGLVACQAVYTKGDEWYQELKKYIAGNLSIARTFFEENMPKIKLVEPEGTYLIWLDCSKLGLSVEELESFVEDKAKLWVDFGKIFGRESGQFIRINIACPRAVLKQALEQLGQAYRDIN